MDVANGGHLRNWWPCWKDPYIQIVLITLTLTIHFICSKHTSYYQNDLFRPSAAMLRQKYDFRIAHGGHLAKWWPYRNFAWPALFSWRAIPVFPPLIRILAARRPKTCWPLSVAGALRISYPIYPTEHVASHPKHAVVIHPADCKPKCAPKMFYWVAVGRNRCLVHLCDVLSLEKTIVALAP